MDIIIIKLGAIGDVIRTTAILPGLREKYKNCRIDWAVRRLSSDVLKNNRMIDNVYMIEDFRPRKSYDLAISLDDEDEACRLASKIDAKKIVGAYMKNGKRAYTDDSSLWFDMGLISGFGKKKADELKAKNKKTHPEIMYKILGLKYRKQEPILGLGRKELDFGKKFAEKHDIKKSDIAIGINTGAGGRWEDKKLSVGDTAKLIGKLSRIKNSKIILFGGPEETERNKKIIEAAGTGITDAGCNNPLMEFASLVNLCDVLVTSDSLALHIGIAMKKKVVCFFYPTSAAEIELYGRGIKIIGKGKDYCSYKAKCDYPPKWDVNEMVKAVKRLE
jgi:heptosyltransferase-2